MDLDALLQQMMQGPTEEQKRQARAQALAAAGFGILGAQGGSGWPGAVRALGRGGLLGMNVYNNELANQSQAPMQNLEMLSKVMGLKAQQQSMDDQQKMRDLASSSMLPGAPGAPEMGPTTAQGQMQPAVPPGPPSFDWAKYSAGLAGIDPVKALQLKREMAKDSPLDKFKPENYTPQSLSTFMRTNNPADLVPITKQESAVGKINPADFTPASVAKFMQSGNFSDLVPIDKRAVTNVRVNNVSETEYDKTIGKQYAEEFGKYQDAGRKADTKIARMNAMNKLLEGIDTNSATPIGMKIAGAARAIGLELDPKLDPKQAAEALANEMALESRAGGQMPGALSDKDREFLQAMNPNIAQTPGGRAQLIEVRRRMAQREKDIARLAREYVKNNNGRLDSGFEAVIADFAERNPLFPQTQKQQPQQQRSAREASGRIGGTQPSAGVYRFDAQGNPI